MSDKYTKKRICQTQPHTNFFYRTDRREKTGKKEVQKKIIMQPWKFFDSYFRRSNENRLTKNYTRTSFRFMLFCTWYSNVVGGER